MAWFRCLIRGENFVDAKGDAYGFYATRWVEADDAPGAESACLAGLRDEKTLQTAFVKENSRDARVHIDEVERLRGKPKDAPGGLVFFPMSETEGG